MTTIITTLITETEKRAAKSPEEWKAPAERREHPGELPAPLLRRTDKRKRLSGSPPSMQEVLEKYRAGTVTLEELVRIPTTIVEEKEERSSKLKFSGLRRQVTASELFSSDIIDQNTLTELTQGTKTVQEITEMDSVKRYLQGTSCIAGVLVPSNTDPSRTEKMSIYQAMWKGILRPGTALVLLEAQAATGFITDPLKNEKLSVDEAAPPAWWAVRFTGSCSLQREQ
ncbi:unnamed protein product [Caretta caretta]